MVTDEKLQQIADETGAVFWRITPDGTRVLHVNGNYENVWGRPAEELYEGDQGWLEAVHPDDRSQVEDRYFSGLATGDYDAEYRVQRPDGSIVRIHDRGFPVHGNHGELKWIAGLASDVSKRRNETASLEAAKLKQKAGDRVRLTVRLDEVDPYPATRPDAEELEEELKSLTYAVSHDLRAPLRVIDGFSAAVQEDFGDQLGDDGRRMLGIIRAEAIRASSMMEDLLQLSRLSCRPMDISELDMVDIFESSFRALAKESPANEVDFCVDSLPSVTGDAFLMRTVVKELLGNACKFSDPKRRPKIVVSGQHCGGEARFHLSDNGRGMRGLDTERVFELFERPHGEEDIAGNGSGLAIVKRLIARHRGRVWCESNADYGATFSFALPR